MDLKGGGLRYACCHPRPFAVILSVAKDLALRIFMAVRDSSSVAAATSSE